MGGNKLNLLSLVYNISKETLYTLHTTLHTLTLYKLFSTVKYLNTHSMCIKYTLKYTLIIYRNFALKGHEPDKLIIQDVENNHLSILNPYVLFLDLFDFIPNENVLVFQRMAS